MDLSFLVCPTCGSNGIEKNAEGQYFCKYCRTHVHFEEPTEAERVAFVRRYTEQANAEMDLKLSPPRFDDASDKYRRLCKDYPKWSAAYWGLVRAKFGIKYENDGGVAVPLCYKGHYFDFRDDPDFKKALQYAETPELHDKYVAEAERIAITWREWEERASKVDFDVFLSFKHTDDETDQETVDIGFVRDLHAYLVQNGYKVFFSPVTMREYTGQPVFDAYILNALEKSKVLLVYGSKPEYFTATWVEAEWTRYLRMIREGSKLPNSLLVVYKDLNPGVDLPTELRKRQNYNAAQYTAFPDLLKTIGEIFKELRLRSRVDHVDVASSDQGRKAVVGGGVETVTLGNGRTLRKDDSASTSDFEAKDFRGTRDRSGPTLDDELSLSETFLQSGRYGDAESYFQECIRADEHCALAYAGLLCARIKSHEFYLALKNGDKTRVNLQKDQFKTLLKIHDDLLPIVENADSKEQGEGFIRVIAKCILEPLLNERDATYAELLKSCFHLVNSYQSPIRNNARKVVTDSRLKIIRGYGKITANALFEEIVNTLGKNSLDEFIRLCLLFTDAYIAVEDSLTAQQWTLKVLEHDEGNAKAIYWSMLFAVGVQSPDALFQSMGSSRDTAEKFLSALQPHLEKLDKAGVDYLFSELCELEIRLLEDGHTAALANARTLYEFLVKYEFSRRAEWLESQRKYYATLCSAGDLDFVFGMLANDPSKDPDYFIDIYLSFASECMNGKNKRFDDARRCLDKVFEIQAHNHEALYQLLLCDIGYGGDAAAIRWGHFNEERLKEVLRYMPGKKEQTQVLKKLLTLCQQTAQHTTSEEESLPVYDAFNILMRYYSIDDEARNNWVIQFGTTALENGFFSRATEMADISLSLKNRKNIEARRILLFAALGVRDEKGFRTCRAFHKNMPEYKDLLFACAGNQEAIDRWVNLADDNIRRCGEEAAARVEELDEQSAEYDAIRAQIGKKTHKERAASAKFFIPTILYPLSLAVIVATVTMLCWSMSTKDSINARSVQMFASWVMLGGVALFVLDDILFHRLNGKKKTRIMRAFFLILHGLGAAAVLATFYFTGTQDYFFPLLYFFIAVGTEILYLVGTLIAVIAKSGRKRK